MNPTPTRFTPRLGRFFGWRVFLQSPLVACLLAASAAKANFTAAQSDPRFALGYLVVTHYAGVAPNDPSADCRPGIQQAINDAKANYLAVFFPAGTYYIGDTLHSYTYTLRNNDTNQTLRPVDQRQPALIGSKLGASRPVIKLKPNAANFGSAGTPRPLLTFNCFEAETWSSNPIPPTDPLGVPDGFRLSRGNLYNAEIRNLDFDCSGALPDDGNNDGAFGVAFPGAQNCAIFNVRVDATGAHAGFYRIPGVGITANVEVEGGKYGIVTDPQTEVTNVVGVRLLNQKIAALVADVFNGPLQVVGFYIKPATDGKVIVTSTDTTVASKGTFLLMDGTIDMSNNIGAVAITNPIKKTCNVRNVYVTGTTNVIKSGAEATITADGTWKWIKEYTYSDQTFDWRADEYLYDESHANAAYRVKPRLFKTFAIINGQGATVRSDPEPLKDIQPNVLPSDVPSNLISRHLWTDLPSFEDGVIINPGSEHKIGSFVNPLDPAYGATPNATPEAFENPAVGNSAASGGDDDRAAIQAAIDKASEPGHPAQGRVLLPPGVYHIGESALGSGIGLKLHANTKLIGTSILSSIVSFHDTWRPDTGSPVMIDTVSDADATTFLGWIRIHVRRKGGGGTPELWDRFGHLRWQAGARSMTVAWKAQQQYVSNPTNPSSHPRALMKLTGNGGGRHYGFGYVGNQTGGADYRTLHFAGTTQPAWFYTCNVEAAKGEGPTTANIEITDARNIRLIGIKREKSDPTMKLTNAKNVGIFGHEMWFNPDGPAAIQVLGASDQILLAWSGTRGKTQNEPNGVLLREAIHFPPSSPLPVVTLQWPQTISIYKRGTLDDAIMIIGGANTAPTISNIANQTINEDGNTGDVPFTVGDAETAAGSLTPSRSSSNQTLVPDANIVFGGSGANRTVKATPAPNQNGTATITVTVSDGALTASDTFLLTVNAVNDAPTISNIANQTINEDGNTGDVPFTVGDAETAAGSLTPSRSSSNQTLVPDANIVFGGSGANRTVTVTPAPNQSGTATITVTVSDGALTASDTFLLTVNSTAVGVFSANQDIGNPGLAGSATYSSGSGQYTVAGSGADIYGTSDQFRFLNQAWSGDGRLVAHVVSQTDPATHNWAKAGVMFRESAAAGARHVDLVLAPNPVPGGSLQMAHRAATAGTTSVIATLNDYAAPYWLRLERHANRFTGWHSFDGTTWFVTGSTTSAMTTDAFAGLAVTSHDNTKLNTAIFDNVSLAAAPVWTAADVGSVGAAGNHTIDYATDVFTLNGAGANIWGTADSFHFCYQALTGDATIVAEVTSVENTNQFAKGGLMIRQSLVPGAVHATVDLTPGTGTARRVEFLRRTSLGGTTASSNVTDITPPRFLKLVRAGNAFSAYHSSNSITWTQVGTTQTIAMTGTVYVGLVSCSIVNTTNLCTSTFESVYIK